MVLSIKRNGEPQALHVLAHLILTQQRGFYGKHDQLFHVVMHQFSIQAPNHRLTVCRSHADLSPFMHSSQPAKITQPGISYVTAEPQSRVNVL